VRTLVLSLRAFMTTKPGELGSVATLVSTQRICALQSTDYHCRECGLRHKWLVQQTPAEQTTITISTTRFLSRNSQLQLQNLLKSSSTTAAASRTFKSNNKTIKTARSLSIVQRLFQNMRPKSVIALCLCFSLMLFISWVRSQ
jgi:sensor c-di-GMP phosphodiesterase-like protein